MADETVILSSPGLVAWNNGEFGDDSYGGLSLSIGLLQGTATTSIDVAVSVTGTQLTSAINSVTLDIGADVVTQGTQINLTTGNAVASIPETVTVAGSQINLDEGSVTTEFQPDAGWGVSGWGVVPWGQENDIVVIITEPPIAIVESPTFAIQIDGNISVNADEDHNLLIFAPNGTTIAADANVNVTGTQINITEGLAGAVITANANVNVTGSQLNFVAGSVTAGLLIEVPVTGSQVNFTIGNEIPTGDANVSVTGTQINLSPGQVDIAFGYNVTGSQVNFNTGQVTITGSAVVNVTGIRLNLTVGSVNIQAWAEVQTGASNIWTPVDLAA